MFLRKVGRWCFVNGVALSTNVPGQSQQNGVIEGSMNQVMALTSVQLQCSFLNELFWDRSFMLAIFILARRYRKNSKSIHLRNSWHKSSYTAWSGLLFDISILICAFGQALILKNDKKSNQYKRQGELALFMGIPANSKGWLVWNVPRPVSPSLETRNIFATLRSKRISDFRSGGGTADHLTGSLLTN